MAIQGGRLCAGRIGTGHLEGPAGGRGWVQPTHADGELTPDRFYIW